MISILCKNKKCQYAKKMLSDAKNQKVSHCEFLFNLINGPEIFCTPDGRIEQSAYFEIQADSEEEREQKLKCIRKKYGKEATTVFENIPGTNPLAKWELTPEILMKLSACIENLHTYNELTMDIFDPNREKISINEKPSGNIIEVWSRFLFHRFSLSKYKSMPIADLNNTAAEWTFEDIEDLGSEQNLAALRYIAEGLNKKDDNDEQVSEHSEIL